MNTLTLDGKYEVMQQCDDCMKIILRMVNKQFNKIIACKEKKRLIHEIAKKGYYELMQWSRKNNYEWDTITCAYAALSGNFEMLKWMKEQGCDWDAKTTSCAALRGDKKILKWAKEHGCDCNPSIVGLGAYVGNIKIIKWAEKNGIKIEQSTFSYMTQYCIDPQIYRWGKLKNCNWNSNLMSNAALGGHKEILKWGIKNGYSIKNEAYSNAALGGYLDILKWLHEKVTGDYINLETCKNAALEGHLDILKWIGMPKIYAVCENKFHSTICKMALDNNQLETYKWCHSKGCGWKK